VKGKMESYMLKIIIAVSKTLSNCILHIILNQISFTRWFKTTHHSAFSGSMLTTSAKPASAPSGSVSTKPSHGNKIKEKQNYNRYKNLMRTTNS
jgi:hypothetical protein